MANKTDLEHAVWVTGIDLKKADQKENACAIRLSHAFRETPEAERLWAEEQAARERGEEVMAERTSKARDALELAFRDANKGFQNARRRLTAARNAYEAAVEKLQRFEDDDEAEGDGQD